jgi:hypothetical protein
VLFRNTRIATPRSGPQRSILSSSRVDLPKSIP